MTRNVIDGCYNVLCRVPLALDQGRTWDGKAGAIPGARGLAQLRLRRGGRVGPGHARHLDYEGAIICIDPKGENAAVTARRRKELGQEVFALDPWRLSGLESASFNPLDWLDPQSPDFSEDAMLLADTLVIPGGGGDSHWDNEARALIAGLLMYICTHDKAENRRLVRLYRLLSLPPEKFEQLIRVMMRSKHEGVAMADVRMHQKADREASGVISSAQANLHFLGSERMAAVLKRSDFDLLALKAKPATVFLVLPADKLATFSRWLRLMVSVTLSAMARSRARSARPVRFLLDEFAALGHLRPVETAMGLLRGYGVKLWPILQDLSQLRAHYPRSWESFVANADIKQVFGTNDQTTAEYFSRMLGQTTIEVPHTAADGAFHVGHASRLLMMPDEIRAINPGNQQVEPAYNLECDGAVPLRQGRVL